MAAAAALAPIMHAQAGMTVLSVQAGQSILSASALFRLKCSMLNQQRPSIPASQRLSGVRNRRQLERRLDTPYSRNQYQPFQWPVNGGAATAGVAGMALADNFSGVMAAHQLRHKPRTRSATAAAVAMGDVGDSLFPGLSSSLPGVPALTSLSSMSSSLANVSPTEVLPSLPDMPPLSPSFGSSSLSSMPTVKFETTASQDMAFAPFSPSAGFMDMRDFQLPMSPYSTSSAIDDNLSVKSEESSYRDEVESVIEDEDANEHMSDPSNDAALAVASVLVRAHEAGYDMDSLTTQIQIALLK